METVRCSKRRVKPNIKYINENFTSQQQIKPANTVKKNIAKPANKKRPAVNVSKKAPLSSKASLPIQAPLPPKAPVPSEKPLPPKKVRSNVSSPKKVISKKSKYRVDFTNVTDLVTVSDCRIFLLEQLKINEVGRRISIKERKHQIIVKCEKFMKKEDVRTAVKKFLKSLNVVHLTKVTAASKSGYAVSKK